MSDVSGAHSLAVDHQRYLWALFASALARGQDTGAFGASWCVVLERLVCDVGENEGRKIPSSTRPKGQRSQRHCGRFSKMKHGQCGLKEVRVDESGRCKKGAFRGTRDGNVIHARVIIY